MIDIDVGTSIWRGLLPIRFSPRQRNMGSVSENQWFFDNSGIKMTQTRKHLFRRLQSSRKHAQSTEHILITYSHAGEVLITPLELRARSIWSSTRLKTGSQSQMWPDKQVICVIFDWKIIKKSQKTWFFGFSRMYLPRPRAAQRELRNATRWGNTWDMIKK